MGGADNIIFLVFRNFMVVAHGEDVSKTPQNRISCESTLFELSQTLGIIGIRSLVIETEHFENKENTPHRKC